MIWSEGHRRFQRWVDRRGETVVAIAREGELGVNTLRHFLHGRRAPSLRLAVAIEELTIGYVRCHHWLEPAEEDL